MGEQAKNLRHMHMDRIIHLSPSVRLHESGTKSLDLHSRLRLLLNILDEQSLQDQTKKNELQ